MASIIISGKQQIRSKKGVKLPCKNVNWGRNTSYLGKMVAHERYPFITLGNAGQIFHLKE